jgi:hypothetical protein
LGAPCQRDIASRGEPGCSRLFVGSFQQDSRAVGFAATHDDNSGANDNSGTDDNDHSPQARRLATR